MAGLLVPNADAKRSLRAAGYNADGEFIITNVDGQVVQVPNEWRAALAAHLIADIGLFSPHTIRTLRELQQRATKKRGGKLVPQDAQVLGQIVQGLECLIQEYLEADPNSSTRYAYRPTYHQVQDREDRESQAILARQREEYDDTPMPWEEAKV